MGRKRILLNCGVEIKINIAMLFICDLKDSVGNILKCYETFPTRRISTTRLRTL